jgi:putative PIN family toxin of toxin-antitoxin system
MKIVVDTSVIVAALFGSKSKNILYAWREGKLTLSYSHAIFLEYQRIIGKIPSLQKNAQMFFTELEQSQHTLFIEKPDQSIDDFADKKFVECAVAVDANYIISLDTHLLNINEYNDIQTIRPVAFLQKANISYKL